MSTCHLDLGCGPVPRNPYHRERLVGIDIQPALQAPPGVTLVQGNFVIEPLPFADNVFDSLSAYDVVEHIPRQLVIPPLGLVYPFVRFMNEVHRVLKPGGLFLASTPGYPRPEAFQDPTHVNIITLGTAQYFCGPEPKGRMYGFGGHFTEQVNRWCIRNNWVDSRTPPWRRGLRRFHRRFFKGGLVDIVWEFRADK